MPPGRTAAASRSWNAASSAGGKCMNCADTRSYRSGSGTQVSRSSRRQVIRRATSLPAARGRPRPPPGRRPAAFAARSRATADTSTAVTVQPRRASQMASAPSPHPASSASPGARSAAWAVNCGLGCPLHSCPAEL